MNLLIKRVTSLCWTMAFAAFVAVRTVLDIIGYATVPDDAQAAQGLLRQLLLWMLTIPAWLPFLAMAGAFMWLTWVSWPRQIPNTANSVFKPKITQKSTSNPMPALAATMRFAKGRLAGFRNELNQKHGGFDLDLLGDVAAAFRATEVSLQKIGFSVPWLDVSVDPVGYIERNLEYISKVEPLISAGHDKEARRQAAIIVGKIHSDFIDPERY